jgi:hypothetical protein
MFSKTYADLMLLLATANMSQNLLSFFDFSIRHEIFGKVKRICVFILLNNFSIFLQYDYSNFKAVLSYLLMNDYQSEF